MTAEGIAIAHLLAAEKRIAELEANQAECVEMLNNFYRNTGSLGAKSLVDKLRKQAGEL